MSAAQNEFNELMRDKERRTRHPEDDQDDARSFLNLSDEDEDRTPPASNFDPEDAPPRASTSSARHIIPHTRYGANTGPKGVISDAQNFRDSRRQHRMSMRSGTTLPAQAPDLGAQPTFGQREKLADHDDEYEEDLDDEDDDFMRQWRSGRLREMQNGGHESRMHHRARGARCWGGLATVDGQGYLDAVDKSGPDTVVAVYIYDDYVSADVTCGRQEAIC